MSKIDHIKNNLFEYCRIGGSCGPDIWILTYKLRDELRTLAEQENWHSTIKDELEEWIKEGECFYIGKEAEKIYGTHFKKMWHQLYLINQKWYTLNKLYFDKNMEPLTRLMPDLYEDLLNSVIIRILRIADDKSIWGKLSFWDKIKNIFKKEKNKEKQNFTIDKFLEIVASDAKIKNEAKQKIKFIKKLTHKLKTRRNKIIAHLDYDVIINENVLPQIKIKTIDNIIKSLNDLFNFLAGEIMKSQYCCLDTNNNHLDFINKLIKCGKRYLDYADATGNITGKYEHEKDVPTIKLHPDLDNHIKCMESVLKKSIENW